MDKNRDEKEKDENETLTEKEKKEKTGTETETGSTVTEKDQTDTASPDKNESAGAEDENNGDDAECDKKNKRALKTEVKKLKEENEKLTAAFAELDDRYLHMIAEYDNYRRRTTKEREAAYTDAYTDALKEILPAIDNLERALAFAGSENRTDDKLTEGVVMTLHQFTEALGHMGIEIIGEKGEKFSPELHNAVMHEEDETKGENEIAEVFQKGYKREQKVIRHAMVKVVN
jgi:molecular chaperone GrpE